MILPINQRCTFTVVGSATSVILVTNNSVNNNVAVTKGTLASAPGLTTLSFVPNLVGIWQVVVDGVVEVRFQVSESDLFQTLKDVKDSTLGSWSIQNNELKVYRTDNSLLAEYDITSTSKSLKPT